MFTYPNVDIAGDLIIVRYWRAWPEACEAKEEQESEAAPRMWPSHAERGAEMRFEGVLRVYPVEWFYT